MTELRLQTSAPQAEFLSLRRKFRAFVGGYGSGKTWTICAAQCLEALQSPGASIGYFAPTYRHIRDIFYPAIDEVAGALGMTTKVTHGVHEVALRQGRRTLGRVICRSMDRPSDIVGFSIGLASVDELDVMPMGKAQLAWRKIIARMRTKDAANRVDVATTPEGFGFTYDQFVRLPAGNAALSELYGRVHAHTASNAVNLPPDYVESLRQSYPEHLVAAYLRGEFVPMTSGRVYADFDRALNRGSASLEPAEPIHVGMDFNVQAMAAVVGIVRADAPIIIGEVFGARDTPSMIAALRERWPGRSITVYPDASGGSRSTHDASTSDLALLRQAGFTVRAPSVNPPIRDRVVSVCAQIRNAQGARRLLIDTDRCPRLTEALEQQTYDSAGMPDKSRGHDHLADALGYWIVSRWPVARPVARVDALRLAR